MTDEHMINSNYTVAKPGKNKKGVKMDLCPHVFA